MGYVINVLKYVETPLQLAALALLVFYAIARRLITDKGRKIPGVVVRLLIERAFLIGLVALVLAVGGPLLMQLIHQDDLLDGSVYASDGSALQAATVSAPPIGPRPVNLDGSFELRISGHNHREKYVVTAKAEGYKSETRTVAKSGFGSIDFQLEPSPVHAVRQIVPELVVGQYYGLPTVVVSLQTMSQGNSQAWISEMTASLSNGHLTINLFPQFVTTSSAMGPYQAASSLIPINPGIRTTIRFLMTPNADINALGHSISSLPPYDSGSAPCSLSGAGSYTPLTDQAFELIRSFAQNKFIWTEGNWTFHFKVTAGGQDDVYDKTFNLSAADVQGLRDSIGLMRSCQSVNGMLPLAQNGAVSNYLLR